jgi:putative hydrolase of the HAD superfamily
VLWDVGGVILTSPFEAFARYETEAGLPSGFIRSVNATDPDTNAWARLERGEITLDEFATAFETEARALGGNLSGATVIELLSGEVRPEMVVALQRCKQHGLALGCVTNNFITEPGAANHDFMDLFDAVVASSVVGVRKPERRFYELACAALDVQPFECVYLDDLGINLKPARAMGMTTIKVDDADQALAELEATLGVSLR